MNPELKKVIDQQNQVRVNLINNDNIYRTFSPYEPTLSQVFSASFNQFAPYEAITRLFVDEEYEVEEGYDPFADNQIKDAGLEGYIYRFKEEYAKLKSYNKTLKLCHSTVGKAILNTSITIVFGFSILVMSNFIPTIYFGVFTGIAMLLAMVSVLTLLPSLLLKIRPFN